MLNLHFLGTCSGTEPYPDQHHQSWILTVDGVNYWFDAGENCTHRAHTSGINTTDTAAIFISHPHIDHIGGLPLLLTCLQKMTKRFKKKLICNNTLKLYFPDMNILPALKLMTFGRPDPTMVYTLEEYPVTDGVLFDNGKVRVTALHNTHMKEDGSNGWHSYSFLIEAEGKRIVYSGDVKSVEELLPLIGEKCDALIMESGHHDVKAVFDFVAAQPVAHLYMTHHGRAILDDRQTYEDMAAQYSQNTKLAVSICYDGMTAEM